MLRPASALLLLFLVPLLGCENPFDPAARSQSGRYKASVTGAIVATFEGTAQYGPGAPLDNYPYHMSLSIPGEDPNLAIVFAFGEALRPGTYKIVNLAGLPKLRRGEALVGYVATPVVRFRGTSGALRITSTSPLRGTFEFQAEGREDRQVMVRGEFSLR